MSTSDALTPDLQGRELPAASDDRVGRNPSARAGRDPDFETESDPNLAATLRHYARLLYKRRYLILSILAIVGILGTVRTLMQTPLYTASVRLQIDQEALKVVNEGNVTPTEGAGTEFLRTQFELLKSTSLAERVVKLTGIANDPDIFAPPAFTVRSLWGPHTESAVVGKDEAWRIEAVAGLLASRIAVRPVPGSRLVDVSYTDPSPDRAQQIASAYGEAFIAATLDKRFEANAFAKTFWEDQTQQLKIRQEDSENALLASAEKEHILVVQEKSSIAENNLAAANAALGTMIAERIKNEQLWTQVESANAIDMPQILTNSVIDTLLGKRKELTTEYQEKLETFEPNYPVMMQISNKIAEIDRQLAAEVDTIKNSFEAAYRSSLAQEANLKSRVEELKREVDTNRELYNSLLQRLKEVDVAGGVGANTVFIVEKAKRPGSPSSPLVLRAVLLSLILGLGAGIGVAYLLEILADVIGTGEEAERITGLPTLGLIPKFGDDVDPQSELENPRSERAE